MPATSEPEASADEIGLTYLLDDAPGITRRRCGRGFTYRHEDGRAISKADRARIVDLAIPPAWVDVWISPDPRGHLQATGRDDRERKQYLYHEDWRVVRDRDKFDQLRKFGQSLPAVRRGVAVDLSRRGPGRRTVLALLVHLLDTTLARVGNEEYAEENESYGLTTLQPEHATLAGRSVKFCFVGKSGATQTLDVDDRRVATLVRHCRDLGGSQLFTYKDGDMVGGLTSTEVNDYLHQLAGDHVTARDFRTWGATVEVTRVLGPAAVPDDEHEAATLILEAIDQAAERLGNTRAVCRSSYVHPVIPGAFLSGELACAWRGSRRTSVQSRAERATLAVLDAEAAG
jgi:DNA topoisomerase-1